MSVCVVDGRSGLVAPQRSLEQRRAALDRANEVRTYRAQLKKDLKQRRVSLRPLLEEPPALLESMKVLDLLIAAPKVGRVKATKALRSALVSPSKTVGGLSDRQRGELLALIAPWAR